MTRSLALLLVGAAWLTSCSSHFSNVWEDADWQGAPLQRVLVVGKEADAATRRAYEDAMSERLRAAGIEAEPSHRTVPDDQLTPDAIGAAIQAGRHDGMIAARLVGVDERMRYQPGVRRATLAQTRHTGWRSWDGFTEPGSWRIDRVARIETQVWSLAGDGTLIWAGSSEAVNPRDIPGVSASLADATVAELQRAGILKKQ